MMPASLPKIGRRDQRLGDFAYFPGRSLTMCDGKHPGCSVCCVPCRVRELIESLASLPIRDQDQVRCGGKRNQPGPAICSSEHAWPSPQRFAQMLPAGANGAVGVPRGESIASMPPPLRSISFQMRLRAKRSRRSRYNAVSDLLCAYPRRASKRSHPYQCVGRSLFEAQLLVSGLVLLGLSVSGGRRGKSRCAQRDCRRRAGRRRLILISCAIRPSGRCVQPRAMPTLVTAPRLSGPGPFNGVPFILSDALSIVCVEAGYWAKRTKSRISLMAAQGKSASGEAVANSVDMTW